MNENIFRVRCAEEEDHKAWDDFVFSCPEATFFHRYGWKRVVEKVFHHTPYYLLAESFGEILGVLPLGRVQSLFFGDALISVPFCVYGGVAAVREEARRALEDEARNLAYRLNVDYLELRHRTRILPGWPLKNLYVTFRKKIDPDPERNLLSIPRKQRAMVRKGKDVGLEAIVDHHIDRFFLVYSTSVRNLGTPVYPKRYFQALKSEFGKDCDVLVVTKEQRVVASVMSFYFRDEILPYYGGGTEEARNLKANDFMYWEVMKLACERGSSIFDYGRSKEGTGSYHFKKNWGFKPEPLTYQYCLVNSKDLPNVSPTNKKYNTLIKIWQGLPLPIANCLGPFISRSLA